MQTVYGSGDNKVTASRQPFNRPPLPSRPDGGSSLAERRGFG